MKLKLSAHILYFNPDLVESFNNVLQKSITDDSTKKLFINVLGNERIYFKMATL